ncbi:sensor histidine kinase [Bryobacter aggregatus]|uniref:sensor histidine kinase n=1 Tax=Bryobacter aggregatus TaxID=360054 RepID=UPI0012BAA136|nr:ATP-binding protein [Bryobacter aggregatus]
MFPIRIRLTLIFGGLLFFALVLSGVAVITLLRQRLTAHLAESLDHRLRGVENFLVRETTAATADRIPLELAEYASTQPEGHLIEVRNEDGQLLLHGDPVPAPALVRERSFRLYGRSLQTRAAASTVPIEESVQEVTTLLAWSSPLLLVLIGLTGYWISRGSLRPVDAMTSSARSIGAGNLSGRLVVPRPRDELSRLAEAWNEMLGRLEESFSRMRRFTEDAAHELRTPLSALRATVELSLRKRRELEEYRQTLESVLRIAERLNLLTESLLAVARSEDAPDSIAPVNLAALLRGLATELEPLFTDQKIAFHIDVPQASADLYGDADALRHLVAALLENALKYTGPGGTVRLRLQEAGAYWSVAVIDTGCGIPENALPRIFDRFYRVDPSRDRASGGYGLGLAIAQQIARSHAGRIEVSSVLGQGSCFSLLLPRDPASLAPAVY